MTDTILNTGADTKVAPAPGMYRSTGRTQWWERVRIELSAAAVKQ